MTTRTDAELIARALERLEAHAHEDAVTVWLRPDAWDGKDEVLTKPLAALIETVSTEVANDKAGYGIDRRALEAALLALCRAIVGERG